MQKWEYMEVRIAAGDKGVTKAFLVNGRELPNWKKGSDIWTFLNQLGDEGWEIYAPWLSGGYMVGYLLKRPK